MRPFNLIANSRLLWAVLLPVVAVGVFVSFFALNRLTPPLAESLQQQTDRSLYHTSEMAVTICEERFYDLLDLRLETHPEMKESYLQEAVFQIKAIHPIQKGIDTLIIRNNDIFLGEKNQSDIKFDKTHIDNSLGKISNAYLNGKEVRFLTKLFPYWDLHIITYISTDDYNAPVHQARRIVLFGTFGVLLTVLLTLATLLVWHIHKPLNRIISATGKVASGEFVKAEISGNDEISQVAKAFNSMVTSLEQDKEKIRNILEDLKNSEEQYRILTENILAYIAVVRERRCLFINTRLLNALEFPRSWFDDNEFYDVIHPEDRETVDKMVSRIEKGKDNLYNLECRFQTKGGDIFWVELQANQIFYHSNPAVLLHGIDITARKEELQERKLLEHQLNQAQKMEAIGTLAGGVAHDFNNMLGGIMGAAELLGLHLPDDPKVRKFHQMILDSAGRAADLTAKLLTFSRTRPQASTPVNVHDIIQETVTLLKNTIDKRIDIQMQLHADRAVIIGDPTELQNVFLNLCINSSHAMPNGGTISIESSLTELDALYCEASTFDIEEGEFIDMEIRDTGSGIQPELLDKIFDPFFTTKEQGKGTGLGLASAYGAVRQHHGTLTVYSEVERGTTFHILLPLATDGTVVKKAVQTMQRGSGRILVVDDEEVMRVTAKAILEGLGYEIILAENGKQAVDIFEQEAGAIDLVLLDMVMPVMNGRDCFAALQKHDPDVAVLLSSGFTREEDLKELKLMGLKGFIRKPYRSASLSQAVHEMLGDTPSHVEY